MTTDSPLPSASAPAQEKPAVSTAKPDVFVQEHPVTLNTGTNAQNIEIDTSFDDENDSTYSDGSGVSSETTSISSSVFSYTYLNGRRYHSDRFKKADYHLPNDDVEQDRLDMYHHIFMLLIGGQLHTAPLDNPQRILDVGTGTGIWAIDMAMDHPEAEVIGTDISPIQPSMVPPNCRFEVDDMEEPWTYPMNHFDYIHLRCLSGAVADWDELFKQAYNHLAPGGVVEFQDYGCEGFTHNGKPIAGTNTPMARWMDLLVAGSEKMGRPYKVARTVKDKMIKAGFVDVHESCAVWPIGEWPKDKNLKVIGQWTRVGFTESLETYAGLLFMRTYGWTVNEVKKFCAEVAKDLSRSSPNKYYYQAWFVWGRKPAAGK